MHTFCYSMNCQYGIVKDKCKLKTYINEMSYYDKHDFLQYFSSLYWVCFIRQSSFVKHKCQSQMFLLKTSTIGILHLLPQVRSHLCYFMEALINMLNKTMDYTRFPLIDFCIKHVYDFH